MLYSVPVSSIVFKFRSFLREFKAMTPASEQSTKRSALLDSYWLM